MKNGIKELGIFKATIIVLSIIMIICSGILYYLKECKKDVSFASNDEAYFMALSRRYDDNNYKIQSLDAYYLEDTKIFYYEMKYDAYIEIDDLGWCNIDKIRFGKEGIFEDMFCLNWDAADLENYQDEIRELERAKKEGIHKSYTIDEIMKKIEEAKKNDN